MNILVLIFGSYLAIAILIAFMVRKAPVGYEDETGFHRGERPVQRAAKRPAQRQAKRAASAPSLSAKV